MRIDLDSPDLQWVGEVTADPMGRVFTLDGIYHRAVYNEKVPLAQELIEKGVLDYLADNLLMPRQYLELISHAKFGMVMRSETAKWRVRTVRFPLNAVRRAALVWLAINRYLLRNGYALCDGHYGNFALFDNCVPKWVDIGSIVRLKPMYGVEEFLTQFIYPLLILSRVPEYLSGRHRLLKNRGVTKEEAQQILAKAGADAFSPEQRTLLWAPSSLPRGQVLNGLRELVLGLSFKWPKTLWSDYRKAGLGHALDSARIYGTEDPRDRTVLELVKSLKPREILDVGANKGYHSCMFANQGFEVLAVDTDEFSVNTCYDWLRDKPQLHVCCSFDSFKSTKHTADTVVSLALTHHLTLSSKLTPETRPSFDDVADRYAEMAERHLIVEFMPNGLGGTAPAPDPLPEWYTLERFLASFSRRFENVRVVDWSSERAARFGSRTLVHCSGIKPYLKESRIQRLARRYRFDSLLRR